jgi:hypothetical protein
MGVRHIYMCFDTLKTLMKVFSTNNYSIVNNLCEPS